MQHKQVAILIGLAAALLSGCSDFRQAIGSEKSAPDEFQVVVRPPLSLPPDFKLRPNAENLQTAASTAPEARNLARSLLEQRNTSLTGYADLFQLSAIEPDIRRKVDEETAGIRFERRLPLQIIFGGLPDVGPVLDQMAEDRRLRTNRLQKRALNEGATPAIDGVLGDPVKVR
ncbi:MAG: DUF3035 domain-containing protein [Alphaproteobacteria bacterium]|jgi:hypothetical protein|nr:DUF3035 domain-containing protein [Alphaproteobacteria bacterium]